MAWVWAIIKRGWRDAFRFCGSWLALLPLATVLVGFAIHFIRSGLDAVLPEAEIFVIYGLAAGGIVFFAVLLWNIIAAPYRIERDAHNETKALLASATGQTTDAAKRRADYIKNADCFELWEAACIIARQPPHRPLTSGNAFMELELLQRAFRNGELRITLPPDEKKVGVQPQSFTSCICHRRSTYSLRVDREEELEGVVEVDGAYFGGHIRPANMKADRVDRRLAEHQTGTRRVVVAFRERKGGEDGAPVPSDRDATRRSTGAASRTLANDRSRLSVSASIHWKSSARIQLGSARPSRSLSTKHRRGEHQFWRVSVPASPRTPGDDCAAFTANARRHRLRARRTAPCEMDANRLKRVRQGPSASRRPTIGPRANPCPLKPAARTERNLALNIHGGGAGSSAGNRADCCVP